VLAAAHLVLCGAGNAAWAPVRAHTAPEAILWAHAGGLHQIQVSHEVGGAPQGGASASGDGDVSAPLLARARELGIKRVGLIYSPRKSWWTGVFFVTLSIVIFLITIVTAVWK